MVVHHAVSSKDWCQGRDDRSWNWGLFFRFLDLGVNVFARWHRRDFVLHLIAADWWSASRAAWRVRSFVNVGAFVLVNDGIHVIREARICRCVVDAGHG